MSERVVCSSTSLGTDAFSFGNTAWSVARATWLIARKALAALEAMLAAVMCLLSSMAVGFAAGGSVASPILVGLLVLLCLACPLLCFSCLMLTVKFLSDGGQGLLNDSYGWWCGVAFGVVLVFAGFASSAVMSLEVSTSESWAPFGIFVMGTPLLIPAAHMLVERSLHVASETRLKLRRARRWRAHVEDKCTTLAIGPNC
jgi:hypothetical protein